jgi:hypothetical protein
MTSFYVTSFISWCERLNKFTLHDNLLVALQQCNIVQNRVDSRRRCIKIVRARERFPENVAFRCLAYNFREY